MTGQQWIATLIGLAMLVALLIGAGLDARDHHRAELARRATRDRLRALILADRYQAAGELSKMLIDNHPEWSIERKLAFLAPENHVRELERFLIFDRPIVDGPRRPQ